MTTNELKEMVDPVDLAEYLGLEYQERSGRFLVLCPFHNDQRLGSAYIKDGYFKCFSCGESMDIIELVRRLENGTFKTALKVLTSLAGVSTSDLSYEHSPEYARFLLTKEELKVLNISRPAISLRAIYTASPEEYRRIIVSKAGSELLRLKEFQKKYADRSSPEAYKVCELYDGDVSPQTFRNLKSEIKSRIRVCNEILERFA